MNAVIIAHLGSQYVNLYWFTPLYFCLQFVGITLLDVFRKTGPL
jgi:hypothetical protein